MNNKENTKKIALLIAGGVGTRMKSETPKQFIIIENKPLIVYTLEAFQNNPEIDEIIVVCLSGWEEILKEYAQQFHITKLKWITEGGATGQESIYNGLMELEKHCNKEDIIFVHDANRPLVSDEIISDALETYYKYGSAIVAIPCREAVFMTDDKITSNVQIQREKLVRTQTPHVYTLEKLLWAHGQAKEKNITNTAATCSLMQMLGENIYFSNGSEKNLKITTKDDLEIFKALISSAREE